MSRLISSVIFVGGPLNGQSGVVEGRYFYVYEAPELPAFCVGGDEAVEISYQVVTYEVCGHRAFVVGNSK